MLIFKKLLVLTVFSLSASCSGNHMLTAENISNIFDAKKADGVLRSKIFIKPPNGERLFSFTWMNSGDLIFFTTEQGSKGYFYDLKNKSLSDPIAISPYRVSSTSLASGNDNIVLATKSIISQNQHASLNQIVELNIKTSNAINQFSLDSSQDGRFSSIIGFTKSQLGPLVVAWGINTAPKSLVKNNEGRWPIAIINTETGGKDFSISNYLEAKRLSPKYSIFVDGGKSIATITNEGSVLIWDIGQSAPAMHIDVCRQKGSNCDLAIPIINEKYLFINGREKDSYSPSPYSVKNTVEAAKGVILNLSSGDKTYMNLDSACESRNIKYATWRQDESTLAVASYSDFAIWRISNGKPVSILCRKIDNTSSYGVNNLIIGLSYSTTGLLAVALESGIVLID